MDKKTRDFIRSLEKFGGLHASISYEFEKLEADRDRLAARVKELEDLVDTLKKTIAWINEADKLIEQSRQTPRCAECRGHGVIPRSGDRWIPCPACEGKGY